MEDEAKLRAIVDAIEGYEAGRRPLGEDPAAPAGKGWLRYGWCALRQSIKFQ